jgi:Ca2+-transporting ATPase
MGKEKDMDTPEQQKPTTPWHSMSLEEVYKELGKDSSLYKSGLTSEEANQRLEKYGENKLSEKRQVTLLERIWKQIANVLVGILIFVAVVSAIRALTSDDSDTILTNWIQVGLIVFVIT